MKWPRQLGERTDRTPGALQLKHIPATTYLQCISQLTGVLTAGPSLLLVQSSHQQVFTSPQLLDKLVGEVWLGALINRLHVEGRAAKPHPGCCS